jgi:quinol monooxygenase YgiN
MSSSLSLIIAGIGAGAAAVGSGVLLARCFRGARGDLIAWSIALIGLLISLGSQTLGYLSGFDGAMFRATELGGQVIAPLAVVLGMSEVAARGLAAKFCARVYLPALAVVAVVVLTLDQLSDVKFTKSWPNPAVYYQTPPNYVLMFAVGPITALVALIAAGIVIRRSGTPGWNALLPAQLAAGAAALLLAYPALVQLVKFAAGISLPIRSEFSLCCTAAAGLIFLAGTKVERLNLRVLHGRSDDSAGVRGRWADEDAEDAHGRDDFGRPDDFGRRGDLARPDDFGRRDSQVGRPESARRDEVGGAGGRDDRDRAHDVDQTGDFARFDEAASQGVYRGGGPYRPEPGTHPENWRDGPAGADRHGLDGDDDVDAGYATGDYDLGHEHWSGPPGADSRGQPDPEVAAGGYSRHSEGWQDNPAQRDRYGSGAGEEPSRADLFGQIAIYTLLEDRVREFDQLTERVVQDVRGREPETLVYIVHAVPSAPMQRILYEVYRDRAAYERHRQQPYVVQFEAERRPYVLATNVIELGLQQAKVSPFPSVAELFGEPGYDTSGFERPDYLRDYGKPQASQGDSRDQWTPGHR